MSRFILKNASSMYIEKRQRFDQFQKKKGNQSMDITTKKKS